MTASEVRAIVVGFVVVCGAVAGALVWRQQHPDSLDIAKLASPLHLAPAPSDKPAVAALPPAKPPTAAAPAPAHPNIADLGTTPTVPKAPEPAAGRGEPPHFDVVRVEPTGEAVLAGKGDPNAKIELLASGKIVAETTADTSGHFVLLPTIALSPGNHDLTLRQSHEGGTPTDSTQSVAVAVPPKSGGPVVVALAEPGKPTRLLSDPPKAPAATPPPAAPAAAPPSPAALPSPAAAPAPAAAAKPETPAKSADPGLAIRSVELENGNGFFASGAAAPGTHVEIYLNGAHLAGIVSGADSQWSVTIKKGLTGGHYAVRADATGDDHRVVARVEVPFDVPVEMAQAPKPAEPAPPPVAPAEVATASPPPSGPEPPSAPNPDEVPGLGPETAPAAPQVAETPQAPPPVAPSPEAKPEPKVAEAPIAVPTPRPDIAAAAKAQTDKAPTLAPPTLAVAPPSPPAAAKPMPPQQMAVAPAKPAEAPPTLSAAAPAVAAPKQADMTPAPAPASAAHAVIEEIETALVVPGDNLWNISRARLGHGRRFTEVYAANVSQIRDPKLIYPGQVFVVPPK